VKRLNGLALAVLLCAAPRHLPDARRPRLPSAGLAAARAGAAPVGGLRRAPRAADALDCRREGAGPHRGARAGWPAPSRCTGCSPRAARAGGRLEPHARRPIVLGALVLLVGSRLGWRAPRARARDARPRRGPGLALALGALALVSFVPHGGPPAARARRRGPGDGRASQRAAPRVGHRRAPTTCPDWGNERALTPRAQPARAPEPLFETCWSASVFTLSSHVSMLTGLPPALHGTTMRHQHRDGADGGAALRGRRLPHRRLRRHRGAHRRGRPARGLRRLRTTSSTRRSATRSCGRCQRRAGARRQGHPGAAATTASRTGGRTSSARPARCSRPPASGSRRAAPAVVRGRQPLRRALALRALARVARAVGAALRRSAHRPPLSAPTTGRRAPGRRERQGPRARPLRRRAVGPRPRDAAASSRGST
jgi:hypothetical protein